MGRAGGAHPSRLHEGEGREEETDASEPLGDLGFTVRSLRQAGVGGYLTSSIHFLASISSTFSFCLLSDVSVNAPLMCNPVLKNSPTLTSLA